MAGSLPGIPLSQQFDANGSPLRGALLYIYAANTTTPQDSFLDSGLTIKNPWPLQADATGRLPMLYLADGAVHVRLTDAAGVVQFDYPSMLVIGPSSGGGGGGGVDPTTIFQTGDVIWLDQAGLRSGWVRDNGRTIGSVSSGATERASADTQALYVFGWAKGWAVVGGAGASALADFNANKQITLPDKRGYSPKGDTAMGSTDSLRLASVPFSSGNSSTAGSLGGEATHVLTTPEIPSHNHTLHDPGHPHSTNIAIFKNVVNPGFSATDNILSGSAAGGGTQITINSAATGITIDAAGGGALHNNEGLIVIGTYFRKL